MGIALYSGKNSRGRTGRSPGKGEGQMRTIKFWRDDAEVFVDDEGNTEQRPQWFCSDGIATYYGDTKSEAASRFGVPIGFDD